MKKEMNVLNIKSFVNLICILSLMFIKHELNATHIVGGNITYKYAGNNKYTIHLTVRRDCFNGDPEAFFDSPASVGIFDSKGKLLTNLGVRGQLYMAYRGNQTIEDPITESFCSIDGVSTVCIHQADYEETIFLPYLEGGYYLEYQRCCRNLPLQNITDPLEAGASWIVHISEDGQKLANSTPDFGDWSQIFLCASRDYNFDHGANDPDGDSLVYKMWTPFLGASKSFPKPQPPASPDFNPVKWASLYNESNMLGGTPLRIDSKTGKLSAVPNTLGQFLIGVQVEEYRDGKLISTIYRDFEVKVLDCGNLVDAKIIAPKLKCDEFTVNFKNENVNARKLQWFFDYDRNKNATSTDENPVYKYTDTGTYRVALVVTKDSTCFDTAFHIITLKSSSFTKPLYDVEMSNCMNGELQLSLLNKSTGVAPAAKYNWMITYNGRTINSNQKNPILTVPNGAVITVQFSITEDGDGCNVQAIPKTFTATYLKPEFHFDQAVICVGDSTKIKFIATDSIKGKYNYQWDPNSAILSGGNTAEPTVMSTTARSFYLFVNVDNKKGCTSRDSILIIARPKPKLDFRVENALGSLNAKFINLSDQLNTYQWDFGVTTITTDTSSLRDPSYTFPAPGTYQITLSTKDGCAPTITKSVKIGSKGILIIDTIIACNGQRIGINPKADSQYIYKWTPAGKLDDANAVNPKFVVDSQRTFMAQLFDRNTGVEAGKHTVLVIPAINPNSHLDRLVVCIGDTVRIPFIQDPTIFGKYTYLWESHPAILSGGNTASPLILSNASSPFYLYVNINNGAGCIARDSILIDPKVKPKLDFTVENALGSLDAKFVNLSDQLNTYRWDFGVTGSTTDTSSLRNPSYTYPAKGMYMITLSTLDGCAPSVTKKVNIGGDGIILSDTINSCIGRQIGLNPKANHQYTYKWSPTNQISDANVANPIFIVDSSRTFVAALFDAVTGVAVGTLNVIVRIPVSEEIKAIKDTIIACDGQPVGLNRNGNRNLKYVWSPANLLNDPTAVNPLATVNGTTRFMVTITNPADSCVLTKSVVVVIPSRIAVDLIPDSLNACTSVPIALNPNNKFDPNLKYKWFPGRFLDDSTSMNPKATINNPTIFKVTITDIRFTNCMVMKTVSVKIPLVTELGRINDSITACAGVAVGINPTGDPRFKYEWSPAAGLDDPNIANPKATVNTSTIYIVKITDTQLGNCTLTKSVKVKVPPVFTVEPTFKDSTSCTAVSFRLGVKSNNPNVKFEWFNGNTSIARTDTVTVRPTLKTTYRVVGTDENGCQRSENVTVDPAGLTANAIAPNNGALCQGDSARLGVNVSGANQGLRYEWTPANQIQSGANTANPIIKPTTGVSYAVKVTNSQGCSVTATVTVRVLPVIPIAAVVNPTSITIGQSSQITSTVVTGYTYRWTPIDGLDNPNIPNPRATPKQTSTYTLAATSPDGCVQSRSVTITVIIPECAEPYIFLPNAFTPNGDGKNDELCLRSNIVATMSLIIFNRWGEKVFETRNQSTCWDGRYKGKLLNPDVYGYYLTVDCINGEKFNKKGNITILR